MMSRVLKVPDEKFRDKIYQTLTDNLTTIRRELGVEKASLWSEEKLYPLLKSEFEKILGKMTPAKLDRSTMEKATELSSKMITTQWLHQIKRKSDHREVKIRDGVNVTHRTLKTTGGLIRADYEVHNGQIRKVDFSGDFFCYPRDSIEKLGAMLEEKSLTEIMDVVEYFCRDRTIEIPGVSRQDLIDLLED
jgi:lipoate-protein ligase A